MIKIPKYVDEWSIGMLTDLLHEGYDENQTLEFKISVNSNTNKIAKTVCGFANTVGGYLICGIDSDRTKNYQERIVGIEIIDQTKRQIIDQINNINPHIPSENLQFKKNNIQLPNKKVVVILQVFPSNIGPHQFEHIFYKRLPDGNEPMTGEEVKNNVIRSQKNATLYRLLLSELGVIRSTCEQIKNNLEGNQISVALTACEMMDNDTSRHFLYNQSFLYSAETQNVIQEIVELTQKLSFSVGRMYDELENKKDDKSFKDLLKNAGLNSLDEYIEKQMMEFVKILLNDIDYFEKITGSSILKPRKLTDILNKK